VSTALTVVIGCRYTIHAAAPLPRPRTLRVLRFGSACHRIALVARRTLCSTSRRQTRVQALDAAPSLTVLSQTGEPRPDPAALTGHMTDPNLRNRTSVDSPDAQHETTDQEPPSGIGHGPAGCPHAGKTHAPPGH
jgi:hypothetical protein